MSYPPERLVEQIIYHGRKKLFKALLVGVKQPTFFHLNAGSRDISVAMIILWLKSSMMTTYLVVVFANRERIGIGWVPDRTKEFTLHASAKSGRGASCLDKERMWMISQQQVYETLFNVLLNGGYLRNRDVSC